MRHEPPASLLGDPAEGDTEPVETAPPAGLDTATIKARLGGRSLVLIGMMGAGKSTIGRRLAKRLGLDFTDADAEIERAAGMTIPEIFEAHGEEEFRRGERAVIARLLGEGPRVLATGGGAFMDAETRGAIAAAGLAIWLKADLEVLMTRVRKRANRPLLQDPDPEGVMRRLLDAREPVYANAPVIVISREGPHEDVVADVVQSLAGYLTGEAS
ncbi:MAG: shikimate kinase [Pseudomonadota bacterium]